MRLLSISVERDNKIRSLLTNQTTKEVNLFRDAIQEQHLNPEQLLRVDEALEFNLGLNYGSRELDRFYAAHPVRVARFMAEWLPPGSEHATDSLVASLAHNVLEKKLAEPGDLERRFGQWVGSGLVALVPDRAAMAEEKGRATFYAALHGQHPEIQMLKFFDKFDNLFALCINPDGDVREAYLEEIERHVRPIAARLACDLLPYLDALIAETRKTGHVRPTFRET